MTPQILISGSYNAFAEGFNGAGVYMASGLFPSQTFERPVYIGSAENLKRRIIYDHIPRLTARDHKNPPLESYCSHHGTGSLVWWLLETCEPESTLKREQQYLDSERPFADERRGFNICHFSEATFKGRKHSPETKLRISLLKKGIPCDDETRTKISQTKTGTKLTQEHKDRIRARLKGKPKTQTHIARASTARRKPFAFRSPTGERIAGTGIRQFAEAHGLSATKLSQVLNGKRVHHKGWRLSPD